MLHHQGKDDRADGLLQESLAIFRDLNLKEGIAHNLDLLGVLASSCRNYSAARSLHEESLAIQRECKDKRGVAASLLRLGHSATSPALTENWGSSSRQLLSIERAWRCFRRLGKSWVSAK